MEKIIAELEKETDIKTFTQALKSADISDSDGPLTIFAILDKTLTKNTRDTATISKDELMWHIVKGKYDDLSKIKDMGTIDGKKISVDTAYININAKDSLFIYVNDVIVNTAPTKIDGAVIYKIDQSLSIGKNPPAENDEKAYLQWLAQKLEGEWRLEDIEDYYIYTWKDYETNKIYNEVTLRKGTKPGYIGSYWESFNLNRANLHKGLYGEYKVIYDQENCNVITNIGYRADAAWWGLELDNQNIRLFGRTVWSNGQSINAGNMIIDREFGIGREMKYITPGVGHSLNPMDDIYPGERDSLVYIFSKTKNKP